MRKKTTAALTIATACLLAGPAAWAQQGPPGGRDGQRPGPPAEAIEACVERSEGDACRFETPRGELEGTCRTPPRDDDGALACVPEGRGGPRGERGADDQDDR